MTMRSEGRRDGVAKAKDLIAAYDITKVGGWDALMRDLQLTSEELLTQANLEKQQDSRLHPEHPDCYWMAYWDGFVREVNTFTFPYRCTQKHLQIPKLGHGQNWLAA